MVSYPLAVIHLRLEKESYYRNILGGYARNAHAFSAGIKGLHVAFIKRVPFLYLAIEKMND